MVCRTLLDNGALNDIGIDKDGEEDIFIWP